MSSKYRTDRAAQQRYIEPMQRSLNCVAGFTQFRVGAPLRTHPESRTLITTDDPIQLKKKNGDSLWLKFGQVFHFTDRPEVPGERKVVTDAYAYTLSECDDLSHELLSWHWDGRRDPHLHVGHAHPTFGTLAKYHVPTGRIAFEEILLFCVLDLDVEPAHDDWENVINSALKKFRQHRTWS